MHRTGLIVAAGCIAGIVLADCALAQSMTSNEVKGTNISRKWRGTPGLVTTGPDGKVIFLFGETQPSVVCSPLQVCDIELQGGEIVRDVLVGDTVRWKVEPATSGATGGQAIHLIVKPSEAGLLTSMVVTTSRRTYHIQLKSHPSQYMARIGFEYPEDVSTKLADINARLETGGIPGSAPDKLNLSYSVSGGASWRPKRVYSDGAKTYIQFPRSISGQDAPVLFVVSGGQNRIVNYRMKNDMMIVDYAIEKAVLVSGVGWRRQKITIRRGGCPMRKTIAAIIISVLSGCQTADETLTTSSASIAVTGATASAIAGDLASRLAEQAGTAGTTTFKMDKDTSEYAAALEAALKGWGYTVITDGKTGKDQMPVEVAWSIDSFDGQVLARVSTPTIALGRAYTATSAGATPASPLSIMQRN